MIEYKTGKKTTTNVIYGRPKSHKLKMYTLIESFIGCLCRYVYVVVVVVVWQLKGRKRVKQQKCRN